MNRETDNSTVENAETALRRIASLPAPTGLEDRVHAALASAKRRKLNSRSGQVLAWPAGGGAGNAWLRSAAAAAIAFVVVGGGWGMYARVKPSQPGRVIPLPVSGGAQSGFGSAGAIRTPQTVNGPVLMHTIKAAPEKAAKKHTARTPAEKKPEMQVKP